VGEWEIVMQSIKVYYTGKRAKTGNLCYDERGRMQVFVTYCDHCHSKIAMDLREAEDFAMKWHHEKKRNRYLLGRLERKII
jgi:nitrate/TMAO reductase-like tetraheme cytochrome c subunit